MGVGNISEANREVETAKRLLRERDEQYDRETNELRKSQKRQLESLRASKDASIENERLNREKESTSQKKNYAENLDDTVDRYERKLGEQQSDFYNRMGRLRDEAAQDLNREAEKRRQQVSQAMDAGQHSNEAERKAREVATHKVRDDFNKYREEYQKYSENKLNDMRTANAKALAETTQDAKNRIDKNINSNTEALSRMKMGENLRFEKLANDTQSERQMMKASMALREQQLVDEKAENSRKVANEGDQAFGQYRSQVDDAFGRYVNDANFRDMMKDQDRKDMIARLGADHKAKEQEMASQFRKSENDLKYQNEQLKHQNDIKSDLNEKRHKQDMYLSSEAIRKNAAITREFEKNNFAERQRTADEDNQVKFQKLSSRMQSKLSELDQKANADASNAEMKKSEEFAENALKHAAEKNLIIGSYERSQQALEDLRQRQLEEQKTHLLKSVRDKDYETNRKISDEHRMADAKFFIQKETFKRNLDEQELNHKFIEQTMRDKTEKQVKGTRDKYSESLVKQQESFEDTTHQMKLDNQLEVARMRNESEHAKRIQLMDLQAKNRSIIKSFEEKLDNLKEMNDAENARVKEDAIKLVRENDRRTKQMLDEQKIAHQHAMDMKERQMVDKLKLQEESYKEQLDRQRRTNELAIKKS